MSQGALGETPRQSVCVALLSPSKGGQSAKGKVVGDSRFPRMRNHKGSLKDVGCFAGWAAVEREREAALVQGARSKGFT